MSLPIRPIVLIIDDEPETIEHLVQNLAASVDARVFAPSDLGIEDLKRADLVLIDHRLEQWTERDGAQLSISLRPQNGVALAGILRSHLGGSAHSPTAFAIHSAHLRDLTGDLPISSREHSIARAYNLEWVFQKRQPGADPVPRISELAQAVAALPNFSCNDSVETIRSKVEQLLGLAPNLAWADRACREIERCHPPIHELSEWSHSLSVLRWLFQRILPYPCFLMDDNQLSARCGLGLESLQAALRESPTLSECFAGSEYQGLGKSFLGRRWWRAGIESSLWVVAGGESRSHRELAGLLAELAHLQIEPLQLRNPVVTIGEDFKPAGMADAEDAVRLQPDDWPPFADDAWASLSQVNDIPGMKALVLDADRDRLA